MLCCWKTSILSYNLLSLRLMNSLSPAASTFIPVILLITLPLSFCHVSSFNITQRVNFPTNSKRHILDLDVTSSDNSSSSSSSVSCLKCPISIENTATTMIVTGKKKLQMMLCSDSSATSLTSIHFSPSDHFPISTKMSINQAPLILLRQLTISAVSTLQAMAPF